MNRTRSVAPGLMPILSVGRHRTPARGACFMEYASFLAGETWSDHPACTHPQLASLARGVNDLTSDTARAELVPYIHRVVGLYPPEPVYAAEIAVLAASAALPVASLERQRALAAGLLSLNRRVGGDRFATHLATAFDDAPDVGRWARHFLASTAAPREPWIRAAEAMINTAVVGIAAACVPDPDARLRALLISAIEAGERVRQPSSRTEEPVLVGG